MIDPRAREAIEAITMWADEPGGLYLAACVRPKPSNPADQVQIVVGDQMPLATLVNAAIAMLNIAARGYVEIDRGEASKRIFAALAQLETAPANVQVLGRMARRPSRGHDDHPSDRVPSADHVVAHVCQHGTLHLTLLTEDDREIAVACFPIGDVENLVSYLRGAVRQAGRRH